MHKVTAARLRMNAAEHQQCIRERKFDVQFGRGIQREGRGMFDKSHDS